MECVFAFATGLVTKIGELVMVPIRKHSGYLIHYNDNINNLKEQHRKLEGRKCELQGEVNADTRCGREISPNVEDWLGKVDNMVTELQRFYEDEVNRKRKCLSGWCPNLKSRYSFSKMAKYKTAAVVCLREEKFEMISYRAAPPNLGSAFTEGVKSFPSRMLIMTEIIEKLKDDQFQRIGICGMGGVGKTTMVKEIIKMVEADKLFDKVAMAVVSQNPDYRKIQGEIADTIGFKFDNETELGRSIQLIEKLKRTKRALIVLDDIWTELEFESIGIPSVKHHTSCKILFTSRNEDVCYKMGSQSNFPVSILSNDEAWDFFQEIAGGGVLDRADMHSIAKEITSECGGLPIAIVTIGKALQSEEKPAWQNALNLLRKSPITSFSEMQQCVYSRIELSYTFLGNEEEAKFCLLLCCLFPEDLDISIEDLLRHGVGLGWFQGLGALYEARNHVHWLVGKLKKRFLLLESNKRECVKMHDVVRDVVIGIATKEHGFMVGWPKEDAQGNSSAISLMLNEIKDCTYGMDCPNLKMLQVGSSKERELIPGNFFQGMSKLMVIVMQQLCISSTPLLFQALTDLHTLRLESCRGIGDVSIVGKELRNLEILSFANSDIKQLPIEIGKLGLLRLLDLTDCYALYQIASNVFKRLSRLEELYLRVVYFPWEKNNDTLAELKSLLPQLKCFEIAFTNVEAVPKDLDTGNLERFWIYVGNSSVLESNSFRQGYLQSNILMIYSNYNCIKESVTIQQLLKKSGFLKLIDVQGVKNVIYELNVEGFPYLEDLSIGSCNDLEYLVDASDHTACNAFPQVQSIKLYDLDNLKEICHLSSHLSHTARLVEDTTLFQCFGSLRDLHVRRCKKLKSVFSTFSGTSFPKLQHLRVESCNAMECIISNKIKVEESTVGLSTLESLYLFNLPNLSGFTKDMPQDPCDCGEERRRIRHAALIDGLLFPKLKYLFISNCNQISSLFSASSSTSLVNLQSLRIYDCMNMEEIVSEGADVSKIVFPRLQSLELHGLSNLRAFCCGSSDSDFSSLKEVRINECEKMEVFSYGSSYAPKLEKAEIGIVVDIKNTKIQDLNDVLELRKQIMELKTSEMPRWTEQLLCHFIQDRETIVEYFPNLLKLGPINNIQMFQHLKKLRIRHCSSLVEVFDSEGVQDVTKGDAMTHYELQELNLFDLPKLMHIWKIPYGVVSFQRLRILKVHRCNKLKSILSPSMAKALVLLQQLYVRSCDLLKEIVTRDEEETEAGASKGNILLPELNKLELEDLPCLKCFCPGNFNIELPFCQEIIIKGCQSMISFCNGTVSTPKLSHMRVDSNEYKDMMNMGDLNVILYQTFGPSWNIKMAKSETINWMEEDQSLLDSLKQVRDLKIEDCEKLLNCVPSAMIHRFQHMEKLIVRKCESLIEIFESKGVNAMERGAMIHYELQEIRLFSLPKVIHIWKNHGDILSFRNLKDLYIFGCDGLKSVLSPSLVRNLFQLKTLKVHYCEMMEEIVTTEDVENFQGQNNEANMAFPKLEELRLGGLSSLKCFIFGNYDLELPSCKIIYIEGCPKMENFCYGTVSTPTFTLSMNYLPIMCSGEMLNDVIQRYQ